MLSLFIRWLVDVVLLFSLVESQGFLHPPNDMQFDLSLERLSQLVFSIRYLALRHTTLEDRTMHA
jgi:hypothetical protein